MNEELITSIRTRFLRISELIYEAGIRSGNYGTKLLVVSKSQPMEVINAAVEAGISIFGENYTEEAVNKINLLSLPAIEWHMIGHVQSRKAESVVGYFSLLHSLDSLKLAARLNRFCNENGKILPVLLEVNLSGEQTKYGFPAWDETHWIELIPDFSEILQFPQLKVNGLMTMPPFSEDPEISRPYFKKARLLKEYLRKHLPQGSWSELSMGTSSDYVAAVEEGATYVRIGRAILGTRSLTMEKK